MASSLSMGDKKCAAMFGTSLSYLARIDSVWLLCYGMAHKRCIRGGCHPVELLNSDKVQWMLPQSKGAKGALWCLALC